MQKQATDDSGVPTYKLFGEQRLWPTPEPVHYETIADRSALYDWEITPHSHDTLLQLLYLESGTADMTLETRVLQLAPPCLVLVPARSVHGFRFSTDIVGHIISIPEAFVGELLAPSPELRPALAVTSHRALTGDPELTASVAASFRQLASEYVGKQPGRVSAIMVILGLILIHAARATGTAHPTVPRDRFRHRLERFSELIDRHFREWRPVGFYADRLGVSSAQLNNTCRRETGQSAQHMIHERLLLEARRLLAYSDLDVTAISYSLGFRDPAYFSRFFLRQEGLAPSAFRQRHSHDSAGWPKAG